MTDETKRHHGLNMHRNPMIARNDMEGGPPEQSQEWPGQDRKLHPQADHGEESYEGGGKLVGLKALITGGDSGIGRATAIAFAREGADVAIGYFDEHADADETLSWIEKAGQKGLKISADVREEGECRRMVREAVEGLGGLNILVNNAAFHIESTKFEDIPAERLMNTFQTNFYGYFWTAQEAAKHLGEGDVVINTTSVVAMMPYYHLIDYAATKAAILNFTSSLADSFAERGIRANAVAPGPVWTPLIAATRDEEFVGKFGANTYWKRPAQPAELAPAFVFLASTDSRFMTGEVLTLSGFPTTSR
ncbi:General stress protein 39 [Jannaschia seosinensis]|uniref:General stress protein 39 n=1 Tax=Jannaschia seosinensis TaxID=313367 RepID=A0A0M7BBI6_9RHOB|nr:SDR family oxidoreductase [Jannaschia seosinensis]CUH37945.1 General stress protein 39 [Jannaschia seosinensis]